VFSSAPLIVEGILYPLTVSITEQQVAPGSIVIVSVNAQDILCYAVLLTAQGK
jgi:hypothetical protein